MRINNPLSWKTPAGFALVVVTLLLCPSSSALSQTLDAGLNFTSNVKFTQNDTGRFAFVFGQGIQNYMNDAPVDVGIELTPGGDPRRPITHFDL